MLTTVKLVQDIALRRLKKGDLAGAEQLFGQILEQIPDDVDAMHGLADMAVEQGNFNQAEMLLGKISSSGNEQTSVLISLGKTYLGQGRVDDAITCLNRAAVREPNNPSPQLALCQAYALKRDFEKAIQVGTKANLLTPHDAKTLETLGNVYLEARQPSEALAYYEQSIKINPDNWQVYANCGMAYLISRRFEDAKRVLTFSNVLNPMEPAITLPLASVLIDLGSYTEAGMLLDKLVVMMPQNVRVLYLAGMNAFKQGNLSTAAGHFIKAMAIDEDNLDICSQLGESLIKEGKTENALTIYNQIIDRDPEHLLSYAQIAKIALFQNQFDKAFSSIEAVQNRVVTEGGPPLWRGESLAGKRLLLYGQFGLDELNLFSRFVNAIDKEQGTVALRCTPPTRALMDGLDGVDQCFLPNDEIPTFDFRAPLEQLPKILDISHSEFSDVPGFTADEMRAARWRNIFQGTKTSVGIMWRKEIDEKPDVFRSIPLNLLKPLSEIDYVQLFSFQTSCGKEELGECDFQDKIQHVTDLENSDLFERLAGVAGLDLLITPDTFTAQIASQAGLPVWMLVTTGPDWYFGAMAEQSIWLPSARLFRQTKLNGWEEVIERVAIELEKKIGAKS